MFAVPMRTICSRRTGSADRAAMPTMRFFWDSGSVLSKRHPVLRWCDECAPVGGVSETMAEHAFVAIDESYASVLAAAQAWQAATDRDIAELTQAARLRASTMFTASAMADRYLALYNDLRGAPARVRGTTAK